MAVTAPTRGAAPSLTVQALAEAKLIPPEMLADWGVTDTVAPGGVRAVAIRYTKEDGSAARGRYRLKLRDEDPPQGRSRFEWASGQEPIVPYGCWRLQEAREAGFLLLVEGESDCWTLWRHRMPALGIPGAQMTVKLEAQHLAGIHTVYAVRERDQGPDGKWPGQDFVRRLQERLEQIGWRGRYVVVEPPEGHKDVSDLHVALEGRHEPFRETLQRALQSPVETVEIGAEVVAPAPDWGGLQVVCMADVEPEAVSWLWEPYVPLGKLTLVDGNPGVGKSWLTLALAAAVSTGAPLPGPDGMGPRRSPANVLLLTAEDGLGDTVRPRLEGMGADLTRIYAVRGVIDPPDPEKPDDGEPIPRPVTLLFDGRKVEEAVERYRPALVVLDPVQAYLGGDIDMNKAEQVRGLLLPLAAMAERHGCAVVIVRHLRKAGAELALYRGMGSIDFAAAARSVLAVAEHPEDQGRPPELRRRVVAQVKNSLAPQGPSIAYTVTGGRFEWAGIEDLSAEALLAPPPSQGERSAVDEAREFLLAALADGPRPAKEVQREARAAGISDITLRRAREGLVRAEHRGTPGARGGAWYWKLVSDGEAN